MSVIEKSDNDIGRESVGRWTWETSITADQLSHRIA
jgi:hypothetical protein